MREMEYIRGKRRQKKHGKYQAKNSEFFMCRHSKRKLINTDNPSQDFHSTQIMKGVIALYLRIRLFRYGEEYTLNVIQAGSLGKRQHLNKQKLFAGL